MLPTRIRRVVFVIPLAAVASVLAGCSKSSTETVDANTSHQTIDGYMAHDAERKAKLECCASDMARAADVDCLNAAKAKQRVMLSGPSTADTIRYKPDPKLFPNALTGNGGK